MSCKWVPTSTPKWNGRKSVYGRFSTVRSCAMALTAHITIIIEYAITLLINIYNGTFPLLLHCREMQFIMPFIISWYRNGKFCVNYCKI
jgi:hypothetical protein